MASNTSNLGLLKKDPLTDGKDTFNIRTMLNDNWDKIDEFAGKTIPISRGGTGATTAAQALANLGGIAVGAVGNLHVWQRVQTYADPVPEVPAGYTLGAVEENVQLFNATSSKYYNRNCACEYADAVTVANDGTVSLGNASTGSLHASYPERVDDQTENNKIIGKFVRLTGGSYVNTFVDYLFYVPEDATVTAGPDSTTNYVVASKLQRVTGYPYTPAIPAGTHVDYLTSTDRNAYPDNVTDAQDAYYTLGEVVNGTFQFAPNYNTTNEITYQSCSNLQISNDGTVGIDTSDPSYRQVTFNHNTNVDSSDFSNRFVRLSSYAGGSVSPNPQTPFNGAVPSQIVYIPSDTTFEFGSPSTFDRYQPVTGHAAIPANTTIEYLGKLGDKASVQVLSYVGTGTYGSSNPNSLTFDFVPKVIMVRDNDKGTMFLDAIYGVEFAVVKYSDGSFVSMIWNKKTVSWYSADDSYYQMNSNGCKYYAVAIG